MTITDRHQAFADIGPGTDIHAQSIAGILVDEGPVGAHQQSTLRFGHLIDIADAIDAGMVFNRALCRFLLGGNAAQQS